MGLLGRHNLKDLVYLVPIQIGNEQLPENNSRMLYCDSKGDIRSAIIENSVYELARSYATQFGVLTKIMLLSAWKSLRAGLYHGPLKLIQNRFGL